MKEFIQSLGGWEGLFLLSVSIFMLASTIYLVYKSIKEEDERNNKG